MEIIKQKLLELAKLVLAVLIIWATYTYAAYWVTITVILFYHIYMIPTYWKNFLERERRKFKEHLASIDTRYTKVEYKERFGYKL